ncbi:MAG: hypothetical protein H6822_10700 [Planctomycetaceae bacterium]|nr:hypothetical protein [Planctomycetales bacterium]MCB9922642.1 hypothetical protein [Planctomycetaceae bacterium]
MIGRHRPGRDAASQRPNVAQLRGPTARIQVDLNITGQELRLDFDDATNVTYNDLITEKDVSMSM